MIRHQHLQDSILRDKRLLYNPKATYAEIRQSKRANDVSIDRLQVGVKQYVEDNVKDGFYESVLGLKTKNIKKNLKNQHILTISARIIPIFWSSVKVDWPCPQYPKLKLLTS